MGKRETYKLKTMNVNKMTLEEKIGQIICPALGNITEAEILVSKYHIGGFVTLLSDVYTLFNNIKRLQEISQYPLLISADYERSVGTAAYGATDMVGNMGLGASKNPELAYRSALLIGKEARALGVRMIYAPAVDINSNPDNPVINIRSFGDDPHLVKEMGLAVMKGFHKRGILSVAKHFPGHGDSVIDSHTTMAVLSRSIGEIEDREIVPFKALIDAKVDGIMPGHISVPDIEPESIPATISYKILTKYLRGKLGFEGVIISDALGMGGLLKNRSYESAVIGAIKAGVDILLMPINTIETYRMILNAVRNKTVSEDRINESVMRISRIKEKVMGAGNYIPEWKNVLKNVGTEENEKEAEEIARECIVLVKDDANLLPLKKDSSLGIIGVTNARYSGIIWKETFNLPGEIMRFTDNTNSVYINPDLSEKFINRGIEIAKNYETVILGAYMKMVIESGTLQAPEKLLQFIKELHQINKDIILISFGNPYFIKQVPYIQTYICAFGNSFATQRVTAELLFDKSGFKATMPVKIEI